MFLFMFLLWFIMCFGFVVVCESLSDAQNRRQQNFVGYGRPSFTNTLCMIKLSAINNAVHSDHLTYFTLFQKHSSSQNELRKKKKKKSAASIWDRSLLMLFLGLTSVHENVTMCCNSVSRTQEAPLSESWNRLYISFTGRRGDKQKKSNEYIHL